jgi:phage repressor protein C with HTH and peptisase S24 domain/predicted XRE-type DNA-binding protein
MQSSKEYKNQFLMRVRLWLQDWIKRQGYTQQQAADKLGTTASTINLFLAGKRSLSDDLAMKIINNSGENLAPFNDAYDPVKKGARWSAEEENRLEALSLEEYKQEVTAENRRGSLKIYSEKSFDSNASASFPLVKVPLFDAGAGEPSEFRDDWRSYDMDDDADFIYVTEHEAKMGAFGIKVNGDSMAPTVEKGDTVIVMPTRHIENGKIVFACWPCSDGDTGKRLIKRYKVDNKGNIILYSDNISHEPILLDRKADRDVRLFRVVKLVKDL